MPADDGLLTVKLGPRATNIPGRPGATLIFHEENEAHPIDGEGRHEALVVAGRVVRVGDTYRVRDAIARGILARADGERPTPAPVQVADVIDQRVDAPGAAAKAGKVAKAGESAEA